MFFDNAFKDESAKNGEVKWRPKRKTMFFLMVVI